jgi:hypothetical protein
MWLMTFLYKNVADDFPIQKCGWQSSNKRYVTATDVDEIVRTATRCDVVNLDLDDKSGLVIGSWIFRIF